MKTVFKSKLVVLIFSLTFLFACKSNTTTNSDDQIIETDTITTMSDTTGNATDTTNTGINRNEGAGQDDTIIDSTAIPNK